MWLQSTNNSELITRLVAHCKTHTHNVLQVAPVIGITVLSFSHSCRSRFLPCFAGMAILAMVVTPNSLSKMCLSDSGNLMLFKEVQFAKAFLPIFFTDSPKVMPFKEVQFAKAPLPMCVTDSPKVMLSKHLQLAKAPLPMCVTDSPKVMPFKEVQFAKARLPMCVTDSPKVMLSKELQYRKASSPMCVTDSPKVMLSKHLQFTKAPVPMCVTDAPKVMLSKEAQYRKTSSPMCVTDSPKVMLSKEMQFSKAESPIVLTDSGIVSRTSCFEFWKAPLEMSVTLEGIATPKLPHVWMSCFVAASTSFVVYATLTWDSALKNPSELSVSVSSMIEVLRNSSTLRTLRLLGSRQGCFSRSIAFNSGTVVVMGSSRVMTPPCRVFNLTSQDMAAKRTSWPI